MPGRDAHHAVVLAAGRGRRMGGPKALMDAAGTPWWRVQAARLERAGVGATWVVSEEVRTAIIGAGGAPTRMIVADPDAPMFSSVAAGLRAVAASGPVAGVFVLPVDVPAAGGGVWRALAATGGVAVPEYRGERGHPVYLPWDFTSLVVQEEGRGEGDGRRLDVMVGPVAAVVPVDDPAVVANLNTPEAYREWAGMIGSG